MEPDSLRLAAEGPSAAQGPSVADSVLSSWNEESEFQILKLRIQRWLLRNAQSAQSLAYRSVMELLKDAESFAAEHDFVTAQILLESALEVINLAMEEQPAQIGDPASRHTPRAESTWHWKNEALGGMDFWRQEFELALTQAESLLVENSGNPFAGWRLDVSRRSLRSNLRAYSLLKSSRDYNSGELDFSYNHVLDPEASWELKNRLEATRYHRDFDLQYWQNTTSVLAGASFLPGLRLQVEDEYRLRRYQNESTFYPNYFQNEINLGGIYSSSFTTRLYCRYNYEVRIHAGFPKNDFHEHRLEAGLWQSSSNNSSVLVENVWRSRDYPGGSADSTYREEYLRADLRLALSPSWAVRLNGDLTLRQHSIPSTLTPDFLNTEVNPQVLFKIWRDWDASAGYLFLLRVHGTPSDITSNDGGSLLYEDYYSHGFTVGLEILNTEGILFSMNHTYEVRTYPDATTQDIPGLSLYSDRSINSLLLFFSWSLTSRWQIGAVANFDDDRSRVENASDSRNTLLSVDFSYTF